jgi:hypothetical protein
MTRSYELYLEVAMYYRHSWWVELGEPAQQYDSVPTSLETWICESVLEVIPRPVRVVG